MTRVAIIGLGSIASKVYLPELVHRHDVDIVGIASRRFETVDHYGELYRIANRYVSVDDVLRQQPEIVFVHASTPVHYSIVMKILEAGTHVYVDKPLSNDIRETRQLTDFATERSLLLAVGFNRRFAPLIKQAQQAVPSPQFVSTEKHRPSPQDMPARETIYDDLIHLVDTLLWLLGEGAELTDYQQYTDIEGRLLLATGAVRSGNTMGQFSMYRQAGSDSERLSVHGDGSSAEVIDLERLTVHEHDIVANKLQAKVMGFGSWDTVRYRRGFASLIEHVLAHLTDPDSCEISARRTLATHQMVESIVRWSHQ
jgi:virulence factor